MIETERGVNGSTVVVVGDKKFTIAIPSRKRTSIIHKHPLLPYANIFVHESEFDDYARHFKDNKIAYGSLFPNKREKCLAGVRNDMKDEIFEPGHDWQYHSDDDFHFFWCMAGRLTVNIYDAPTMLDIITHVGTVAQ